MSDTGNESENPHHETNAPPPPPPGWGQPGGAPFAGQPLPPYGQPEPAPYGQPAYGPPMGFGAPDPAAPFGRDPRTGEPYGDKSKIIAGLLQLVVGVFGVGRFYTGHTGIAIAQLLTCGGLGIWSLIDGILMLVTDSRDAQGRLLRS